MKTLVLLGLLMLAVSGCVARFQSIKNVAKTLEETFIKLGLKGPIRPTKTKTIFGKKGQVIKILPKKVTTLPTKVDLLFVLDRSGSIGNYKLGLARQFIRELLRYFSISPSTTRVALITYSSSVQTQFEFKKFVNRECINKELGKNIHSFGMTATGPALQRAIQLYQSSSSGARPTAERVVFVLTDGRSNRGVTPSIPANTLRSMEAKVFALGIGSNIRTSELNSIASHPSYVLNVATFQDLQAVTNLLSKNTYDACTGTGQRYDECGRRCTCVNGKLMYCCRIRKDFTSMSTTERQRFISAMKLVSTTAPYKQRYDALIRVHRIEFGNGIHLVNQFLPWHRYYILELENLLREVDCRVTVPYWDWSLWAHDPWSASHTWATGTHGLGGNGSPAGSCVRTGPFSSPGWSMTTGGCLRRRFNGVPPDAAQVQYCLSLTNFIDFEIFLRVNLHNNFHCRVDGTMCSLDSANAPEFFLHHVFIDKIWDDWQVKGSHNLNAHFPGVSQIKMRASPYYAKDLKDNLDLPGCVRVCYDDPSHGRSGEVLKFVRGLERSKIVKLRRSPFTKVGEKSMKVFRVSASDRIRAKQMEKDSTRGLTIDARKGLKSILEKRTGFKLVKPIFFTDIIRDRIPPVGPGKPWEPFQPWEPLPRRGIHGRPRFERPPFRLG